MMPALQAATWVGGVVALAGTEWIKFQKKTGNL